MCKHNLRFLSSQTESCNALLFLKQCLKVMKGSWIQPRSYIIYLIETLSSCSCNLPIILITTLQILFIFNKQIVIYKPWTHAPALNIFCLMESTCSCLPCCSAAGTCFWDVMILPMVSGTPAAPEQACGFVLGAPGLLMLVGNVKLQHFSHYSFALLLSERDRKHLWFEKLHSDFCLWFDLVWFGVSCMFWFYSVKFCVLYPFFPSERFSRTTFRNSLNIPKLRICLWCVRIILIWMEGCLTPINHLQIKSYTEFVIMKMNFSWYTETEYIWAFVCMNSCRSWSH